MKKIIMYTTPTCVYCKMAKVFFKEHSVPFEEHDVAADENALKELQQKSHQLGVPVFDIAGEIFVGFDQDAIAKAVGVQ